MPAARLAWTRGSPAQQRVEPRVVRPRPAARGSRCRDPRRRARPRSRPSSRQFRQRRLLGEPLDAEVGPVHPEEQRRVGADRLPVVVDPRAVGGADLAQPRARLRHHVGHAEAAADLHQFAARHDDLPARRQRGQHQERRGGVVVDDDRGLDAEEALQQRLGVRVAMAAAPRLHVVLEVRVAGRHLADALDGRRRQRRAPEVRVHDDAGGVDHTAQRRAGGLPQDLAGAVFEPWPRPTRHPGWPRSPAASAVAEPGGGLAQRVHDGGAPEVAFERPDAVPQTQLFDRRDDAVIGHGSCRSRRSQDTITGGFGPAAASAGEPSRWHDERQDRPLNARAPAPTVPPGRRPSTGRSSASGPTWTCPRSRPTRRSRPSTRRCGPSCSATETRPFSITIVFPRSEGDEYEKAVALAKRSSEYQEVGPRRELPAPRPLLRRATSPGLRDLWAVVGGGHDVEVLIDDRPVPYARTLWLPLAWFLLFR